MQKLETKMSRNKETYDRLRTDLKARKDEQVSLTRSRDGKEKSLTSLESSLESMKVKRHQITETSDDIARAMDYTTFCPLRPSEK
jgi:chromosome segregation ATPase